MVIKLYKSWGKYVENLLSARAMMHGIDAFHRVRACRETGAVLSPDEIARFDPEHHNLLDQIAGKTFTIRHQIFLHAYTPIGT
jgi:hypothetical protein